MPNTTWPSLVTKPAEHTMDTVSIQQLSVNTVIGIYDWERQIRQTVVLDLEMAADCARASVADDVADTLDYKAISQRVSEFIRVSKFGLVEALAQRVTELIMSEFDVPWLRRGNPSKRLMRECG